MFANHSDEELCDGQLEKNIHPDRITVWDSAGYLFKGEITTEEITV